MTDRLYYTDPYLTEFDARILQVVQLEDGRRAAVLDRTAFYPTSGGQPFDTGTLGPASVSDVIDGDDGTIFHVVEGDIAAGPVRGNIDWDRRFDHMQQHTGQHVVSAAFDRLMAVRTESFHLGSAASTIDLAREVSGAEIVRAEDEANRVVWEDRLVSIRFADSSELAGMSLRKEPVREGRLRLIDVDGFDLSACGGTHVARTGAIGVIAVTGWERLRGGTRIEFACGGRALRSHRALRDAVTASIRLVSVLPSELPAGIERIQNEGKELKRQIKDLQGRLASFEAADLANRAEASGQVRVVVAGLEGWDANGLKLIASAIAVRPGHVAVILGAPPPGAIVVARAADATVDCAAILRQMIARFGGKGGGRPDLAQGGGLSGSLDEMRSTARTLLQEAAR